MSLQIEDLGLSPDQVREMLIDRMVESAWSAQGIDEDGFEFEGSSHFHRALKAHVKEAVESKLDALFEDHVRPIVEERIEALIVEETNHYGEPKGDPLTFTEYMVKRCERYLTEKVDYWGKGKAESRSYDFKGTQTRVVWLIHEHLHCRIESAMKEALKAFAAMFQNGLNETISAKVKEVADSIRVGVEIKR